MDYTNSLDSVKQSFINFWMNNGTILIGIVVISLALWIVYHVVMKIYCSDWYFRVVEGGDDD